MRLWNALGVIVKPWQWLDGGNTVELVSDDDDLPLYPDGDDSFEMAVASQLWFDEFDMGNPADQKMAGNVLAIQTKAGQEFIVFKSTGSSGSGLRAGSASWYGKIIGRSGTFPTYAEVFEVDSQRYGGVVYGQGQDQPEIDAESLLHCEPGDHVRMVAKDYRPVDEWISQSAPRFD